MTITTTPIEGLMVLQPRIFEDDRGYFFEAYNADQQKKAGLHYAFLQDNQSFSKYGVIRGLHYQLQPYAQCKLVRVLSGTILDVAVDIRKESASFGKVFSIELSAENKTQLLIPPGFAHGFSVLSETATVLYKCDALYHKESEGGIRYNDTTLNIDWRIPAEQAIISEKDAILPDFGSAKNNF